VKIIFAAFVTFLKLNETMNFYVRTAISNYSMHQKRLAARLHPDPLEKLTALPQTPKMILRGALRGSGGRGRKGMGGRDRLPPPPCNGASTYENPALFVWK
jgi:hypothetical protein